MRLIAALAASAALSLAILGCAPKPEGDSAAGATPADGEKIKIGFLVKQPEEQWFQDEWKFAKQAADQYGFELVTIGATDGEKVLAGIDNLAAQGAKGFIICTPDVKLGPAIVERANKHGMKVMSVDDQFVGPDGKFMDVHHMGISARKIGNMLGQGLWDEMQKRGWKPEETLALVVTWEQLDTSRERTDGAIETLTKAGFPADRIVKAPEKTTDVPGGMDAGNIAFTQHSNQKRWLVAGMNDEAVLGAVRALEGHGLGVNDVIGIGIGGTDTAIGEFKKDQPTGFNATVLISPKRHGFETAELMYKWIKEGKEPPKTIYTEGMMINRETWEQVKKEQGLN
jgi:L-arabinose transport system substrate-binding protein